ncbi:hypothetical protein [Deinococcus peraridilitoris]|uniref:Uncharacterized protein n=1 Tax=Deinococcus peraridilitoris (strain DSM 19664 / LMG 22246 / CIP 109416 / KR-200) TaxID=937777 RepID=L0A146_DEIPD|nr:hypothetical protein [Deinococcus peraridilitoris]AFZ67598.1 hypothetical protein Deipe_2103 [Deinococcus peraridilitoris DSM 19664]
MTNRDRTLNVTARAILDVQISERDLALALMQVVREYIPQDFDDGGCDWTTTKDTRHICIAHERDWVASTNPNAAALLDAANILRFGHAMHVEDEEQRKTEAAL